MIQDILVVMWKEWRELKQFLGGTKGSRFGLLVFFAVFGLFFPLQGGREMIETPMAFLIWGWLPLFLVTMVVADSFAGERERHTLETLLATRLPDRAILFGKIATAVLYGWGLTLCILLMNLISINVMEWNQRPVLPPAYLLIAAAGIGLLVAATSASLGVLISLRSPTVRQAQQTISLMVMMIWFAPFFLILVLPRSWKEAVTQSFQHLRLSNLLAIVTAGLLVLLAMFLRLAMHRFRRARLILD
ncbi:MAG: ABC transporter permease [Candidatus Omnitrophica bacterium]|nr:ABC transporter permease [Candidatus Omnitrophota bacterium]